MFVLLFLFTFFAFREVDAFSKCKNLSRNLTCETNSLSSITVNLGIHSHLDLFWLKTFEDYYYGENSAHEKTQKTVCVRRIFNGVLSALLENSSRTYIFSEIAFFKKWYQEELTTDQHAQVKMLIKNGQIDFANGGWGQNDEACSYYEDIIDQMALGLEFLKQEFGITPNISLNVDSFGHSAAQSWLYSEMGFNGNMVERLDDAVVDQFGKKGEMEFIWQPFGLKGSELVTHLRNKRHGSWTFFSEGLFYSDCNKFDTSINELISFIKKSAKDYNSQDAFLYAGDDFSVWNSSHYYTIEQLFEYFNVQNPCLGLKFQYSTPSQYFSRLLAAEKPFNHTKNLDFFPYQEDSLYWTGYFTTDPQFKFFTRQTSRLFHSFRIFLTQNLLKEKLNLSPQVTGAYQSMIELISLVQHHDGVAATSKYWVLDTIQKQMKEAQLNVDRVIAVALNLTDKQTISCDLELASGYCSLVSFNSQNLLLSIFNGFETKRQLFEFEVDQTQDFALFDVNGEKELKTEKICFSTKLNLPIVDKNQRVKCLLIFELQLQGYTQYSFMLTPLDTQQADLSNQETQQNIDSSCQDKNPDLLEDFAAVKNDAESQQNPKKQQDSPKGRAQYFTKASFSSKQSILNYKLSDTLSIALHSNGQNFNLTECTTENDCFTRQLKVSYNFIPARSVKGWSNWNQREYALSSGKYAIVSKYLDSQKISKVTDVYVVQSELAFYVQFVFEQNLEYFLKIVKGQPEVGIELLTRMHFTEQIGKDYYIIIQDVELENEGVFYTDSNGLFMVRRELNKREDYEPQLNETSQISSNTYPVTGMTYIEDTKKNNILIVLNDRPQGATSLKKGELQFCVYRIGDDDQRGVGERMNKTGEIYVRHWILLRNTRNFHDFRQIYQKIDNMDLIYLSQNDQINQDGTNVKDQRPAKLLRQSKTPSITSSAITVHSDLKVTQYPNLYADNSFYLRIQNTQEANELVLNMLEKPIVASIFDSLNSRNSDIKSITEQALGQNGELADVLESRWRWPQLEEASRIPYEMSQSQLVLQPLQIKLYKIELNSYEEIAPKIKIFQGIDQLIQVPIFQKSSDLVNQVVEDFIQKPLKSGFEGIWNVFGKVQQTLQNVFSGDSAKINENQHEKINIPIEQTFLIPDEEAQDYSTTYSIQKQQILYQETETKEFIDGQLTQQKKTKFAQISDPEQKIFSKN